MKKIPFGDLQTNWRQRTLFVPGGWMATVPEVTPDPQALQAFQRYLEADGMTPALARLTALDTIQGVFEAGYLRGIRNMLYSRVKDYADRWPQLVREDGTLEGFDPERLQGAYFPFERVGRRGKSFVDIMLGEMAKEVLDAEAAEGA